MKKMRKLLALVLSLAMVFGMATVVSANAGGLGEGTLPTEVWMSKTYNAAEWKDFTFEFEAKKGNSDEKYVAANKTPDLTIGDNNKISFADIDDTDGDGTVKKTAKLSFGAFTEAGVYYYEVTETSAYNAGGTQWTDIEGTAVLDMSEAKYSVEVYVEDPGDGSFAIAGIVVTRLVDDEGNTLPTGEKVGDAGETPDSNGFNFENTYVYNAGIGGDPENPEEDPDPKPDYNTYGSLYLDKTVMSNGTQATGDTTKFSFTATFNFPAGTDEDSLGGITANGTPINLQEGKHSFKLSNGESIVFKNVPAGTTVDIDETATANYKPSATIKLNGDQTGTVEGPESYGAALDVNEKELGKDSNIVNVTNTHLYIPTTGVIINVLPFALMLLLGCGALFLFVFTKTRRSSER